MTRVILRRILQLEIHEANWLSKNVHYYTTSFLAGSFMRTVKNSLENFPKPRTRDLFLSERRRGGGSEILKIEGVFYFGFLNFFETHNRRFSTNQRTAQHWNWLPIDLHVDYFVVVYLSILRESTSKVFNEDMDVSAYWPQSLHFPKSLQGKQVYHWTHKRIR